MAEIAVGLALGLVAGLTLFMRDAGGSIITVPALVFITDLPVHDAMGTALLVVTSLAVVVGVSHYRRGATMPSKALALGLSGSAGSVAGAWLNQRADEDLIVPLLVVFLALPYAVGGRYVAPGHLDARGAGLVRAWRDTSAAERRLSRPRRRSWGGGPVGAVAGSRFSGRIRESWHRIVFSVLLLSRSLNRSRRAPR